MRLIVSLTACLVAVGCLDPAPDKQPDGAPAETGQPSVDDTDDTDDTNDTNDTNDTDDTADSGAAPEPEDEDCRNGEDDDQDGLVDCDDPDCTDDPTCIPTEDCADGADNDGDGLVDCEDADCIDATACVEACADGVDNDLDGLLDCEDGDCWGVDHCPAGQIQVTSGSIRHQREIWDGNRSYSYHNSYGSTCWQVEPVGGSQDTFTVTDVHGIVQLPTHAGGITSCEWSVDEARFEHAYSATRRVDHAANFETRTRDLASRSGFTIDPACAAVGSDALPSRLLPASQVTLQAQFPTGGAASFYPFAVQRSAYSQSWTSTYDSGFYFYSFGHAAFDLSDTFGAGAAVELAPH